MTRFRKFKSDHMYWFSITLVTLAVIWGCGGEDRVEWRDKVIIKEVPGPTVTIPAVPGGINLSEYPDVEEYVKEQIALCGPGVVEGAKDEHGKPLENRCKGYLIRIDQDLIAQVQTKLGKLEEKGWQFKDGVTWFEPKSVPLPDNYDIRDEMVEIPVGQRQKRNDCWAVSTHHMMETTRAVYDKKATNLSAQFVISCSNSGTAASGGYMSAKDVLLYGVPIETEYPYTAKDSSCKYSKEEMQKGWEGKAISTPYIGSSKDASRWTSELLDTKEYSEAKVEKIRQGIFQNKSAALVTVSSYSQSPSSTGPVAACSAANSGGNHMVIIVGWSTIDGKIVFHVWNSHGDGHGNGAPTSKGIKTPGVSQIEALCSSGALNRGLGKSAAVMIYKSPCAPPQALVGKPNHEMFIESFVKLGVKNTDPKIKCSWTPTAGLLSPNECETLASPTVSTEYHLQVTNDCGTSSAMTFVKVYGQTVYDSDAIQTVHGFVREILHKDSKGNVIDTTYEKIEEKDAYVGPSNNKETK